MKLLLTVLITFLTLSTTFAQPMITDRPDVTESSSTVVRKSVQVETGMVYESDKYRQGGTDIETGTFNFATTLVRIGLTKRLEFRAGSEFTQISEEPKGLLDGNNGLNGLYVGAKYQLRDSRGGKSEMAIVFGANLPVGNQDIAPSKVQPMAILALSSTLSRHFSLGYNIGGEVLNGDEVNFLYSSSLGIGLTDLLGAFVELYGNKEKNKDPNLLFDTGLTFLLTRKFQLDASTGFALAEDAPDWFINFGFSFRLFR
jgi:hypothetical protein